jgi:hypothetical protein
VVTVTLPVPPLDPKSEFWGEIVMLQTGDGPFGEPPHVAMANEMGTRRRAALNQGRISHLRFY